MSVAARAATTVWEFSLTEAVLAVVQLGAWSLRSLIVTVMVRSAVAPAASVALTVTVQLVGRAAAAGRLVVGRGGELERRAVDLEQVVVVRLDRVGEAAGVGGVRVGGRERGDGLGVLVDRGRVGRGPAGGLVVEVVDRDRDGQVGGGAGGVRGPDGDRAAVGRAAAAGRLVVGRGGELERRAVDLEQVVVVRLDRVGEAAGVGGVRVGGRERGDGLGVLVDRGRVGRGPAGRLVVEVGHPDGDGGRPVAVVGGAVVDQDGELVDVVPAGVGGVVVVGR